MSTAYELFKSVCAGISTSNSTNTSISASTSTSTSKPYVKFDDLPVGDYFIQSFSYVQTKYGKTIRLDIGLNVVFLPQRFITRIGEKNIQKTLDEMNKGQYWLLYGGKDLSEFNRLLLDIVSAEEYVGMVSEEN